MTFFIQSIFSVIAAMCAAVFVYGLSNWLFSRQLSAARSLQIYSFSPTGAIAPDAPGVSMAHKIRLVFAGYRFDVSGR